VSGAACFPGLSAPSSDVVASDLRIDIDLHNARLRRDQAPAVGAVFVRARFYQENDIGLGHEAARVVVQRSRTGQRGDEAAGKPTARFPMLVVKTGRLARSCRRVKTVAAAGDAAPRQP
jgi:hypothetical protein